jgi:AAA15 family ATPase/GTPase
MLKSLKIENFRCFPSFEMQQLGRLNLIVGNNNSGKTSILEAVQLLTSQFNLELLRDVMISRGEYILNDERNPDMNVRRSVRELDICHLFYGHTVDVGSKFFILGDHLDRKESLFVSIETSEQLDLFEDIRELFFSIQYSGKESENIKLPLSPEESLSLDYVRRIRRDNNLGLKTQFVTSASIKPEELVNLFNRFVLTAEEDFVIEALQTIEPKIARIAPGDIKLREPSSRFGFRVRLSDSEKPIPIGSMGDGIWRMLGLALAIVNAKNGVLLVDEIDTGLHYTVMSDMWKMIWETAKRLNVQVFATTHSNDCWQSLADIANVENPSEDGITIHRVEKDKPKSILFTERQIAIAAERNIEVR